MFQTKSYRSAILVVLFCLPLLSCSAGTQGISAPPLTFPATSQVNVSFDETEIPGQCRVFSHLLVSIPSAMIEREIKNRVEQFGMKNGADYILIGMARESSEGVDDISFRPYGPQSSYSFKTRWQGWSFGFRDWNSGGPLVDFGINRLASDNPAFDNEITAQMVLLNCQLAPGRP